MSEVTLRPATDADAASMTAMAKASYGRYVERMGRQPRPMKDDYAQVIREFEVTIAERDGVIAGFVAVGPTEAPDEGFVLENVCVDPAHEGTGVGRTLLRHAEAPARDAGFDSIYLYTHELMTENRQLYARIGYAEYDRRPIEPYGQIVLMRKPLPGSA